jgi:hypothetical protein
LLKTKGLAAGCKACVCNILQGSGHFGLISFKLLKTKGLQEGHFDALCHFGPYARAVPGVYANLALA